MAVQETFYLWLMKDLRPTHNQNSQNHKKTEKNREFLQKMAFFGIFTQPILEYARRFSGFLPCPTQKFPTKITGNFLDYIRELSANNRELYFSPAPLETTQTAPTLPNFDIVVCVFSDEAEIIIIMNFVADKANT